MTIFLIYVAKLKKGTDSGAEKMMKSSSQCKHETYVFASEISLQVEKAIV